MYKGLFVICVILGLSGCEKPNHPEDPTSAHIQLPDTNVEAATDSSVHAWEDVPNAQTTELILNTSAQHDPQALIATLTRELKKDYFKLTSNSATAADLSITDCKQNKLLIIKGAGNRSYWAERSKGIGEKKDFFPDFRMEVMSFETEQQAEQHLKTLQNALTSFNGFCNGKSPIKIVRQGAHLFYFGTRAEMFRGYINTYADFIEKYSS